jgi:hypothetical protein
MSNRQTRPTRGTQYFKDAVRTMKEIEIKLNERLNKRNQYKNQILLMDNIV